MAKRFRATAAQRREVELLAAIGTPQSDIALVVNIDAKTLRRYFRQELDLGAIKANSRVAASLFRMCTGTGREAVICCMFWLKTRCGWYEGGPPRETLGLKRWRQLQSEGAEIGTSWESLLNRDLDRDKPN